MPRRTTDIVRGGVGGVQVNSEVSLEAFREAGEQLCGPDIGRELAPPLWCHHSGASIRQVQWRAETS